MLISSTAFAGGFGGVEYGARDGINGGADARAVKVTVGTSLNNNTKIDFSMRQKTDTDNNLSDTRAEAGLTLSAPLVQGLSVYGRVAGGQKFKTSADHAYYSIEPGVKYQLLDQLSIKAGWRYRDAFDNTNADQSRSLRLGAEYALTKNYAVAVGYDRVRGDSEYNAFTTALNFKF
jgi:predicted porin